MDCTRLAGLVKLTAMESMGGIPSGDSCISIVREDEVEERREEEVGAPEEVHVCKSTIQETDTLQ